MIQSKMIETEEELHCSYKHKLPVLIDCLNEKLLCSKCMENFESKAQLKSFKIVLQNIQENQKQQKENIEHAIMISINLIEELQNALFLLKSKVVQLLDQIIGNVDEWIKHIIIIGQQNVTYSFYNELDNLLTQKGLDEFSLKQLTAQINQIQLSWSQKVETKLNLFKSFSESQKCEDILQKVKKQNNGKKILIQENLENNIIFQIQKKMIQVENEQKQLEQQLEMSKQVEFNLIDESNQQNNWCYAIVFNKDGSIMISCDSQKIKIWNFEKGRFKLVINIANLKKSNNFISGCSYQQIRCWQQFNQNDWKCSQPFEQHTSGVIFLLLNKQEDQLISGGQDHKIIVWKVDFIQNDLTFLYSLNQHTNWVKSLSFNQSETVLASCGQHEFIIWEKGLQGKWEFKYRQDVLYGYKIHFINDQQFLWVTLDEYMNDILVFELQNGVFKQNSNKTISLIKNNDCQDDILFPVQHNKDRNVILVRHKHHIYLIRQLNDGTFNIVASLNSQTRETYGTLTNNGQYLVFWDNKFEKYSSYEIQYK
ncbi:unnamed protein product [Paramecium octaurelia]|uniref:WD40-repeat-containing domain n=1 Tax=Paramecium octaurelia TaxID=43137 RepID=A0A8S1WPQ8_PAROT|nr:unnamed protein product [Paramecium octaurelia]